MTSGPLYIGEAAKSGEVPPYALERDASNTTRTPSPQALTHGGLTPGKMSNVPMPSLSNNRTFESCGVSLALRIRPVPNAAARSLSSGFVIWGSS